MKTLQEIKNEVAVELGFPNWNDYMIEHKPADMVAERYASQRNRELVQALRDVLEMWQVGNFAHYKRNSAIVDKAKKLLSDKKDHDGDCSCLDCESSRYIRESEIMEQRRQQTDNQIDK